jgi:4-alpha-glucanotransferase
MERLKGNFKLFDILRIDHFRAILTGKYPLMKRPQVSGAPGYKFFETVYKLLPEANIIAEW